MKPMMFVPPAQAEALSDTQDDLRDDISLDDRVTRQPWRDDEIFDASPLTGLVPRSKELKSSRSLRH